MFIVMVVVGLSLTGLALVRRRWSQAALKESNDLADPVYSMIGVLYAVLLAFIVVVVWEQFTAAGEHTLMEAGAVSDLYRDAGGFPPDTRAELRHHLVNYANDVVDHEWPAMEKGEPVNLESEAFRQLWSGYLNYQPETNTQIAFYNESIGRLNELGGKRKNRILSSESELPSILWVLLIGGSVICIGYTFLFGTENHAVHMVVVAFLSAVLAFVLFLIFSLEHPYSGSLSVRPDGFQYFLRTAAQEGGMIVP